MKRDNDISSPGTKVISPLPPIDPRGSQAAYALTADLPGPSDKQYLQLDLTALKILIAHGRSEPLRLPTAAATEQRMRGGVRGGAPRYWLNERRFGEFRRCFALPAEAEVDAVEVGLAFCVTPPKREGQNL
ncbi:hypothetical protein HOY80DRAFT_879441 [Tuber brumale]|nr:hypothetical protein HOY80DRAFT_879441 [Tuber brumale]